MATLVITLACMALYITEHFILAYTITHLTGLLASTGEHATFYIDLHRAEALD